LGKEARKLMDLAIPMGCKDHSKEVVKMVKGVKKSTPKPRSPWNRFKSGMRSMLTKHESMLSLELGNTCGETFKISRCPMNSPHVSLPSMQGL
jgi:hypothetical protein